MGVITKTTSAQGRVINVIDLNQGDVAIVDLHESVHAPVPWGNGGVSWTINHANAFSCKVEHSLLPAGYDDEKHWVEDSQSPFSKGNGSEGNEYNRVQRIRFTAVTGACCVVVSSGSKFRSEVT